MAVGIINTEKELENIFKTNHYLIIDFFAGWCGPCKMLAPNFEAASEQVKVLAFFKLNIDNLPNVATKYGVLTIPTLIIFKDGVPIDKIVGFKTSEQLVKEIKKKIK